MFDILCYYGLWKRFMPRCEVRLEIDDRGLTFVASLEVYKRRSGDSYFVYQRVELLAFQLCDSAERLIEAMARQAMSDLITLVGPDHPVVSQTWLRGRKANPHF